MTHDTWHSLGPEVSAGFWCDFPLVNAYIWNSGRRGGGRKGEDEQCGSLRRKGAGFCFGAQIREAMFNLLRKKSTVVIRWVLFSFMWKKCYCGAFRHVDICVKMGSLFGEVTQQEISSSSLDYFCWWPQITEGFSWCFRALHFFHDILTWPGWAGLNCCTGLYLEN